MRRCAVLALLAIFATGPAFADCAADLAEVKLRLTHEKDPATRAAVRKEVGRAEKELNGSETACRNAVIRARRAFAAGENAAAKEAAETRGPRLPSNSRYGTGPIKPQ